MHVAQETLRFRRAGLSPALSLLMSAFALPIPPARFTPNLHRPTERSPTVSGTRIQKTKVRNLLSLFPTLVQALQHFGDRLIFITPLLPLGFIDVLKIQAVSRPDPHFVCGSNGHLQESLELRRRVS